MDTFLFRVKQISIKDKIPIVRDETLAIIIAMINQNQYRNILEIGSGYGYSAYAMSLCKSIQSVISLEKDEKKFKKIQEIFNIKTKIIWNNIDAFVFHTKQMFDLIFIDGAKSYQEKLVINFINNLNKNGVIVIDNLYLKKFANQANLTKNQQALINKLQHFVEWLKDLKDVNLTILDIDDGIAILRKKVN